MQITEEINRFFKPYNFTNKKKSTNGDQQKNTGNDLPKNQKRTPKVLGNGQ
jgi:hypothetical protein